MLDMMCRGVNDTRLAPPHSPISTKAYPYRGEPHTSMDFPKRQSTKDNKVHLTKMTVYSFYIFDRHTECIYQRRWQQLPHVNNADNASLKSASSSIAPTNGEVKPARRSRKTKEADDAKLIFGVIFSLRNMVRRLGGDDDEYAWQGVLRKSQF